ncbi:site-2 protease family protein [Caldisericum exile]|uniref:Peptidase M50 family protein n=1 Tax=Caldisericum exile (strain DSM 21853 / NBRC 104410 / AZM16c01) TaxID=511051 RepID=A0A7U6JGQ4_CALEA|nr:site-2 protease family protein [Caldisericum exile]BAL80617.1 peptidase M50 family protein [Caldisericum exile AZM16c01]
MVNNMVQYINELLYVIPAVLIVLTIHEFGHAYVAYKMGDVTAKEEGRLSLNPLKHIDPIGLLALIIFRFGWGKPVPVDFTALRNLRKGMIFVSLAGPLSNIIIAFLLAPLFNWMSVNPIVLTGFGYFVELVRYIIVLSIYLAIFNLIPIPPLDGSKIIFALTKNPLRFLYDDTLNYYGIIFLVLVISIPFFRFNYFFMKTVSPMLNLISKIHF